MKQLNMFSEEEHEIETTQYTLVKIPIRELIKQNFSAIVRREKEIEDEYFVYSRIGRK